MVSYISIYILTYREQFSKVIKVEKKIFFQNNLQDFIIVKDKYAGIKSEIEKVNKDISNYSDTVCCKQTLLNKTKSGK